MVNMKTDLVTLFNSHIPHSDPSLGSFPFFAQGQGFNPFQGGQGWTNPAFSGLGTKN